MVSENPNVAQFLEHLESSEPAGLVFEETAGGMKMETLVQWTLKRTALSLVDQEKKTTIVIHIYSYEVMVYYT